jgi:hypothetical protein
MMNRRDFLGLAAGGALTIGLAPTREIMAAAKRTQRPIYAGWRPSKQSKRDFVQTTAKPYFAQAAKNLAGSGEGKKAFLWKLFEKASGGPLVPHNQGIGDCVSHGWGLGVDILDGVQVTLGKGEWQKKCATEIIYAGARVNTAHTDMRRTNDGMPSSWAATWCRDGGILLRQPYLGKYDFTTYNPKLARDWAHKCKKCTTWGGGVPDDLLPLCAKHPVQTVAMVESWPEARDSVYNGYPVAMGSSVGFGSTRDRDGFLSPEGEWYHETLLVGMDDEDGRPGGVIMNSWGDDWVDGPTRHDQPVGSFWADAKTIDGMLKQGDSQSMSHYVGYPRQDLDYKLY